MDALQDEVESLEAILMDDVTITRNASGVPELIETTIFPNVGDETDQQFICVTLQVLPTPAYPDVSPEFKLLKPRGLDDARLHEIKTACVDKLKETLGFPVVFDLIEVIREHLSGSNLPSGQCVVCLYGFTDGDEFSKTECFHYLHSYCLARHLIALRRNYQEEYDKLPAWQKKTADPFQAGCPVCREPIKDESDSLKCAMPPAELQNAPDFRLTEDLKELQRKMTSLFLHQKSRGAIIDLDADTGAGVISIETEEEIRRRLQRKQTDETNSVGGGLQEDQALDGFEVGHGTEQKSSPQSNDSTATRAAGSSSTNFAPVVQQTQRLSNDPTNNNYQHHNRRHYRGGRRHQQHHHHHRDRERERERHENHNHTSHSSAAAVSTAAPVPSVSGKQTKGQAACGAHSR